MVAAAAPSIASESRRRIEVKVPANGRDDAALWQAIVERLPMIGAWMVSFFFVLVFWASHALLPTRQNRSWAPLAQWPLSPGDFLLAVSDGTRRRT